MTQGQTKSLHLTVVLFRGKDNWVAQGLDYDIGAQGKTTDDALYQLQRLIMGHIVVRQELGLPSLQEAVPKAPARYWEQFQKAKTALRLEETLPQMSVQKNTTPSPPVTTSGECRIAA